MTYTQNLSACFSDENTQRFDRASFGRWRDKAAEAVDWLREVYAKGEMELLKQPESRDGFDDWRTIASAWRENYTDIVVLGAGGASLGGQSLCAVGYDQPGPRMHFLDNLSPTKLNWALNVLDPEATAAIAISKSGATSQTLAQASVIFDWLGNAVGHEHLFEQAVVITENSEANPLRLLAERAQIISLDHPKEIGGRFSVLSVVGLLPALLSGLDIEAVRKGAQEVLEKTVHCQSIKENSVAMGAALSVAFEKEKGAASSVLMTYAEKLTAFGQWHRQLWAESLGKDGHGTTPSPAVGTVDQHSQLQLYLEGPADKWFTFIREDTRGQGYGIPGKWLQPDQLDYLRNRTLGDMFFAEGQSTIETLVNKGRPVRVFEIDGVDEMTIGRLFMHFMLETILAARLLGVNAFDQPAVESGKKLTRHYLRGMN
jgi:glucose-6-phosphate isomerase